MISRSWSSARYTFASVCASTPWLASTTSRHPSHAANDLLTCATAWQPHFHSVNKTAHHGALPPPSAHQGQLWHLHASCKAAVTENRRVRNRCNGTDDA